MAYISPFNLTILKGCPCGWHGDPQRSRSCTPKQIDAYRGRISGPLLDRFDMHVEVPRLDYDELHQPPAGEESQAVQDRVHKARERQWSRLGDIKTNAEMNAAETIEFCSLDKSSEEPLKRVFNRQHLSTQP
ncbi:ATP-binding protein [Desulfitobacterium dehalogenans]|uniref:ATP-binding protein n=1 Tax=Desulfitobacterium dehalogenans TaxID=36854 RepID=UPI0006831EE0|nr:ATP-binding protein [Desulfitobacterium dehalogenans]